MARYNPWMSKPASTVSRRKRRYDRPEEPKPIVITERILFLLETIARFRFATIHHLHRLDRGSKDKLGRILRDCYDAHLITRTRAAVINPWADHYAPCVYALDDAGAALLSDHLGKRGSHIDWSRKAERTTRQHVDHAVATAETMIDFLSACAARGLELQDHSDLVPTFPLATRAAKRPLAIPLDFDGERRLIEPDRVFVINTPTTSYPGVLELDTGEMPVRRDRAAIAEKRISFAKGTSYAGKLPLYLHAFLHGLHTDRWGFQRLRVFTVTHCEQRITTMRDALATLEVAAPSGKPTKAPPGLFLFTTKDRLRSASPLDAVWTNAKGDLVDLSLV